MRLPIVTRSAGWVFLRSGSPQGIEPCEVGIGIRPVPSTRAKTRDVPHGQGDADQIAPAIQMTRATARRMPTPVQTAELPLTSSPSSSSAERPCPCRTGRTHRPWPRPPSRCRPPSWPPSSRASSSEEQPRQSNFPSLPADRPLRAELRFLKVPRVAAGLSNSQAISGETLRM